MNIESALKLKPGQQIWFPADRGDCAGCGVVVHADTDVQRSFLGQEYVWVLIEFYDHYMPPKYVRRAVWPSNRLSLAMTTYQDIEPIDPPVTCPQCRRTLPVRSLKKDFENMTNEGFARPLGYVNGHKPYKPFCTLRCALSYARKAHGVFIREERELL